MIIKNDEEYFRNVKCSDALEHEVGGIIDLLDSELKRSARLGSPGIGLAAPQIGINKNVAIVRLTNSEHNINLVNCKIEQYFDKQVFRDEGCLSFPSRVEDTVRYNEVVVSGNGMGTHAKFIASGLAAVVIQHEMGHWNNDLFWDHLAPKPEPLVKSNKIKPNEPCLCGKIDINTGKIIKYKKCHGR